MNPSLTRSQAGLNGDAPGGPRKRVLVADDHPLVHQSMSALLADSAPALAIDTALDANMLWDACARTRYALVIVDLRMPAMARRGGIAGFQRDFPDQPASLLTAAVSDADLQRFRCDGGRGILLKSSDIQVMRDALQRMLAGGSHFPESLSGHAALQQAEPELNLEKLSPRLRSVYELLLLGLSNRDIAARLGLTVGTIKNYLHETYRALEVTSRAKVLHGALAARQPGRDGRGVSRDP